MPKKAIGEIHLAGHSINRIDERQIRIDTHSTHVCDAVWDLYQYAIHKLGPVPTLVEWDIDIPALAVLAAEAARADQHARLALAA